MAQFIARLADMGVGACHCRQRFSCRLDRSSILEKNLVEHAAGLMRLVLPWPQSGGGRRAADTGGILEALRHLLSLALIGALWWLTLR
jgi:hypothetical protein